MQLTDDSGRCLPKELESAPRRKGRAEFIKFLRGEYSTQRELIIAKCFDCTGFYEDGAVDCGIVTCPLYKFMPYRKTPRNQEDGEKA
ncbi:MAG: hypothetical protein Q7J09_10470 [Methanocalculus sp.]|uniref:hypothetical protein n=1 Tax=Methanocalculus sp. TaxID=2004547 RepID=UPI0027186193|nr:hypothetical protein [Methanocalculus sp.]MDO9540408.1 hypothetical protein [Methanocalculus sp.]